MKKLLIALVVVCLLAAAGLAGWTLISYADAGEPVEPVSAARLAPDAAARFAGALRYRTVATAATNAAGGEQAEASPFRALHEYIETSFPRVHRQLERESADGVAVLYTWRGADPALPAALFSTHLDVAPVADGTAGEWLQPPFSGAIADDHVWGRGSRDGKLAALATIEAVEMLLADGYTPRRTIHLALAHDGVDGGGRGTAAIARRLEQRGVELAFALGPGATVVDGLLSGQRTPIALVGIAEKGAAEIELSVETRGGRAWTPPAGPSAAAILGAAVARIEERPMPARLSTPTHQMLERIGAAYAFSRRIALANLWLTRPLVLRRFASTPVSNALVRTTLTPVRVEAAGAEGEVPGRARAVLHARLLPSADVDSVVAHVRGVLADERVRVRALDRGLPPSPASPTDTWPYLVLRRTILETMPDLVVAPALVSAATAVRGYEGLTDNVYRFAPVRVGPADVDRVHGANERIRLGEYEDAVRFYRRFLINAAER